MHVHKKIITHKHMHTHTHTPQTMQPAWDNPTVRLHAAHMHSVQCRIAASLFWLIPKQPTSLTYGPTQLEVGVPVPVKFSSESLQM